MTTARGNVHDEAALQRPRLRPPRRRGLDVWEQSRRPPTTRSSGCQRHRQAARGRRDAWSRSNITRVAALAFADAANGRLPPRVINPAVVPRFVERWEAVFGRQMATGAAG